MTQAETDVHRLAHRYKRNVYWPRCTCGWKSRLPRLTSGSSAAAFDQHRAEREVVEMILRNRRQRIDSLIHDALADEELSGYPLSKAAGLMAGTVYVHLARLRDEGKVDGRRDANGRVFYRWIGVRPGDDRG